MSRIAARFGWSSHLLHFQNIHQWSACSWWNNLQPRNWNIVRRAMIHRVGGRNEWDNSSAIRCAFCPSRSNMVMRYFQTCSVLECQTRVEIEPTIERKSRNSTQRYHSVESMLMSLLKSVISTRDCYVGVVKSKF